VSSIQTPSQAPTESHAVGPTRARITGATAREAATFALPFALILVLALRGGGYDAVVRSEAGIAIAWLILLGAIVGLLPTARIGRPAWLALGALVAAGAWTAASIGWTESREASVEEVSRIALYALTLALLLSVQGARGWRTALCGTAAAIALVGVLALGSRLVPGPFPDNATAAELEVAQARLNYPVNYWNGLAALLAIGLPLIAAIASEARSRLASGLAAASIPAVVLACFYTLSRGGLLEIAIASAVLLALYPHRLTALARLAPALGGTVVLVALATQRQALENGLETQAADDQRAQMLIATLVVCAIAGALRYAIGNRTAPGPAPRTARRLALGAGAVAAVAVAVALAAGAGGRVADGWEEFKSPIGGPGEDGSRFESASGNGRWQYWSAAVDANATDPLVGIGAGSYRFFWSREGTIPGVVRDAHSQFAQTLGELGVIGLAIAIAGFGALLVFATVRTLRAPPEVRPWLAAATAGCAAFTVATAIDWVWQLTVVPIAFLCLVAAITGQAGNTPEQPARPRDRWALGALAALGALVIAFPLTSHLLVRASERSAADGDLPTALARAQQAADVAPWAATPLLQEALTLEAGGDLDGAAEAAEEATEKEPTNWEPWQTLSRIEFRLGDVEAGTAAYLRARSLNPRSPLFQ
jgi:hypothetical protein